MGRRRDARDLLENAAEKLKAKRLNLIVANDITSKDAGFGADTNRVVLIHENGDRDSLPLMSKAEVADAIIERVAALLE